MPTTEMQVRGEVGLTLIELIIFILVVTIGLVGILSVLNLTSRSSADPMIRKQMLAVAEGLVEEVASMPFTFCDPDDPSATSASLSGGAITGCAAVENLGPDNNTGIVETRLGVPYFDNANDYFVGGGLTLAPIRDLAGSNIANLAGYTAKIDITANENLSGIASNSTPATMNVLHIAVTVTAPRGGESIKLETYRTRHSPNSVP